MITAVETRSPDVIYPDESPIAETPSKNQCFHHWLIAKANGPVSRGICKYCHEEREFNNSFPMDSPKFWKFMPGKTKQTAE